MSGFYICFRLSLYRGREWEREVKFCGRINKREIKQVVFALLVFGFSQGVLYTIVKPRNVFKTRESKNWDKSERNRKLG